jgi:uncharacterized membrane protein
MSLPRLALRLTKTAIPLLLLLGALLAATMPASAAATYTFYVSGSSVGQTSPAVAKDYTLNITNLNGSASISFNLSIVSSPIGWTSQLSAASLTVGPSATRQITLTVQPPGGALADAVGQFVNVTATPDDNTTAQTVATTTRVNEVLGVSVTLVPNAGTSGDPGVNITWLAYVKNTGNSVQTYTVNINNTSFTSTNLTTNLISVSPGDTRVVLVTINISTVAPVGTLSSRISATSTANASVTDAELFSATVNAKRAVGLSGLTPDDLKASTEPESSVVVHNIIVENRGNVGDSYTLQGTANASRHGDWISFEFTTVTLAGFTQRYLNVTVAVPASAVAGNDYTVEFRIISDNSTSVIAFLNLTISVVAKHDLSMVYESLVAKQSGEPGALVSFPINVSNPGAFDERVDLSYVGINSGWVTISANPFTLAKGDFKIVYYNLTIPGTEPPGAFNFSARGTINWTNPYRNRTVDLTLEVKQIYDTVATASVGARSGDPGDTVAFSIQVRNNGTGTDSFTVVASNTTQAGLVTVTGSPITLPGGATGNVTVSLAIRLSPAPAAGDYFYAVTAKSSGNSSRTSALELRVTVNQVYALTSTVSPSYQTATPGTVATYTIAVTNNGNGPDTVTLQRAGANQTWVSFPTGSGTIPAGGRMNFTVQVTAPSWSAPGDTALTVRAVSGGDASVVATSAFTISLSTNYAFTVSAASNVLNAHRNTAYPVSITVRNSGNQPDTYALTVEGADASWASLPTSSVVLQPNENEVFDVTVTLPADPANGPHAFNITATSAYNASLKARGAFSVTVNDILRPEVRVTVTAYFSQPFAVVAVPFSVLNNGTIPDTYTVTMSTPPALNQFFSLNVTLNPGASAFRTFAVNMSYPYSGVYQLVIRAVSQANTSFESYGYVNVTLEVIRSVELTASPQAENGGPGVLTAFHVVVNNTGNITDTFNFSAAPPIAGWAASFSQPSVTLGPGTIASITVYLQPPDNVGENPQGVTIYATSATVATARGALLLTVLVDYAHNLTGGGATSLLPGDSSTFAVTLTNAGTSAENFTLTVTGQAASWVTLSDTVVRLDPGEQASIAVDVTVPPSEHDGARAFNVEARGSHLPAVSSVTFTVNVRQVFAFTVNAPSTPVTVAAGQTATFPITVVNTGNTNDTYTFLATPQQFVSVSPSSATADALQSRNFSVLFTPASTLPAGDTSIQVTVFGGGGNFVVVNLTATVRQTYAVAAAGQPGGTFTGSGAPGSSIQLAFNISNRGNGADTFAWFLSGEASGWAQQVSDTVALAPGLTAIVNVFIDIPSDPFVARAGLRGLTVTVFSQSDANVSAQVVGSVSVSEASAFGASFNDTSVVTSLVDDVDRASPGTLDFPLYITNTGNRNETVQLVRAQTSGWEVRVLVGGAPVTSVLVGPGDTVTTTVRIVSFPAAATDNTVSVRAQVADGASSAISLSITIHFLESDVQIDANSVQISETSVTVGSTVEVTFTVSNAGRGTATGVQVELIVDGQLRADTATLTPLAPGQSRTVTLTWTATEADAGKSHSFAVQIPDGPQAPADSVQVAGVTKGLLSKITGDRDLQLMMVVGIVLGLVVGLAARGRRKSAPAPLPRTAPPPRPPQGASESTMAGLADLEAEGTGAGAAVAAAPVAAAAPAVEHKIVCPNCGTEQWIRGAEGECKTCGVVIEVEEEGETPEDLGQGL